MTVTFSRRDGVILLLGLTLGLLIGASGGVALSSGSLPAEIAGALISLALITIGGVGAIVKILVDRISADIRQNTNLTRQTLGAATNAANHANERVSLVQDLQAERLMRESAERALHLIEIHPACAGCRQAVKDVFDQWRTRAKDAANG